MASATASAISSWNGRARNPATARASGPSGENTADRSAPGRGERTRYSLSTYEQRRAAVARAPEDTIADRSPSRVDRRAIEIVTTRVYVTACGTNEKRERIDLGPLSCY